MQEQSTVPSAVFSFSLAPLQSHHGPETERSQSTHIYEIQEYKLRSWGLPHRVHHRTAVSYSLDFNGKS